MLKQRNKSEWEITAAVVCFSLLFHRVCLILVALYSYAGSGHQRARARAQPRRAAGEPLQQAAAGNGACSPPFPIQTGILERCFSDQREKSSDGCPPPYPGEKRWMQLNTRLSWDFNVRLGAEDQISFRSFYARAFERWAERVFKRLSSSSFQESSRTISSTPFIKRSCKRRGDQVLHEWKQDQTGYPNVLRRHV